MTPDESPSLIMIYIQENKQDALLWKAAYLIDESGDDPHRLGKAYTEISHTLALVPNAFVRDAYIKALSRAPYKIKEALLKSEIKASAPSTEQEKEEIRGKYALPAGADTDEVMRYGFFEKIDGYDTGYYFPVGTSNWEQGTNFIINPLFHLNSKADNKRLIEVDNGYYKKVLEVPSKGMISTDLFAGIVYQEGNYRIWTSKLNYQKILGKISDKFPTCYELKTLGYQPEGFFAWSNAIYDGENIIPFNELGIASFKEVNYFSPSVSRINIGARAEEDEYENDKYLKYQPAPISFSEWCGYMAGVYGRHGWLAISGAIMAMFKDVIFKFDSNCPLLYAFGKKGSGKSKLAQSISNLFLNQIEPFNLHHGTEFAFFKRLARFRNCVAHLDEMDDKNVRPERYQSLKGAYDGAGRERGKGNFKDKTEVSKINSVLILTGQYMSTQDDNALLSRCIVFTFLEKKYTQAEADLYTEFKEIEKKGLSGILPEILQHRDRVLKQYASTFNAIFSEARDIIEQARERYDERVLRNYCVQATMIKLFQDTFKFPFSFQDFFAHCRAEIIRLSRVIYESDALADFWNTLVYLADRDEIEYGFDFKIEVHDKIKVYEKKQDIWKPFPAPKKLLFIRLENVQKAYERFNGKKSLDLQSLKQYIQPIESFIGLNRSSWFRKEDKQVSSSSYVFDYDKLGVLLERSVDMEERGEKITIIGNLGKAPELFDQGGQPRVKFSVAKDESYNTSEGKHVKKITWTSCYFHDYTKQDDIATAGVIKLTGWLKVNKKGFRNFDVESYEILEKADALKIPEGEEPPPEVIQGDLPF